jgi:hypothetical protein
MNYVFVLSIKTNNSCKAKDIVWIQKSSADIIYFEVEPETNTSICI